MPKLTSIQEFNLKRHGIGFNSWHESNSVKMHSKTESIPHFLLKCIVCKVLYDNGRVFFTEVNVRDGTIDVVDFTGKRVIEIQTIVSDDIIREKKSKYMQDTNLNDFILLKVSDFDIYSPEVFDQVRWKLGLS